MTNVFDRAYNKVQEAKKAYNAATTDNENNEARALYKEAGAKIEALGEIAIRIYREYENSMENGNKLLDLSGVIWERDVKCLISCLRDNGIEQFTFSSIWSEAVKIAWLFQQNGCTLEGLIEINDHSEKIPAYLFRV